MRGPPRAAATWLILGLASAIDEWRPAKHKIDENGKPTTSWKGGWKSDWGTCDNNECLRRHNNAWDPNPPKKPQDWCIEPIVNCCGEDTGSHAWGSDNGAGHDSVMQELYYEGWVSGAFRP